MTIRHALLALLAEGPKYGLLLKTEFEARTGEVWPLNVGQVYSTLQRLERDDLVVESDDDAEVGQRVYRLTDDGRGELDRWLAEPPDSAPPRDELVVKILVALDIPGVDVRQIIQLHRRQMLEALQRYTRLKTAEADLPLLLVADAEIFRCEAAVHWLDATEARLSETTRLPRPSSDVDPFSAPESAATRQEVGR